MGTIFGFIERLLRPLVAAAELDAAYAEKARSEVGEQEALEWAEGLIGDVSDDSG